MSLTTKTMRGGRLTYTSDDGYTIEGRTKGLEVGVEGHYSDVYYSGYNYPGSIYKDSERYTFSGEFELDSEGTAFKITDNYTTVTKNLAVKGNVVLSSTALTRAGVPSKYTIKYSEKKDTTVYSWTERVNLDG